VVFGGEVARFFKIEWYIDRTTLFAVDLPKLLVSQQFSNKKVFPINKKSFKLL
jgi:hypothetical protein